jgi:hypothetical protein
VRQREGAVSPHLFVTNPALLAVEREAGTSLVANVLFSVGILRRRVIFGRYLCVFSDGFPGEIEVEAVRHVARDTAGNQAVGVSADLWSRCQQRTL